MKFPKFVTDTFRAPKLTYRIIQLHMLVSGFIIIAMLGSLVMYAKEGCLKTECDKDEFQKCFSTKSIIESKPILYKLYYVFLNLFIATLPGVVWYMHMPHLMKRAITVSYKKMKCTKPACKRCTRGFVTVKETYYAFVEYIFFQILRALSFVLSLLVLIPRFSFVAVELPGYSGKYECPFFLYGNTYTCPMNDFTGMGTMNATIIMLRLLNYLNIIGLVGDLLWLTFSKSALFNRLLGIPVKQNSIFRFSNLKKGQWLFLCYFYAFYDKEDVRKTVGKFKGRDALVFSTVDGNHYSEVVS